jgi:hypothetical protein
MQENSVLVTQSCLQTVIAEFGVQHVTYVSNSNVYLTESTVYVAANAHINAQLQNACISNVLFN